jgi:hypothetical protein
VSTWCQRGVSTVLTWRQHSVNTVSTWCQRGVNMVLTGCQRGVQTARPCEHPKGRHGPAVSWQREPRNGPGRCPVLGPLRRGLGSNGVAVERRESSATAAGHPAATGGSEPWHGQPSGEVTMRLVFAALRNSWLLLAALRRLAVELVAGPWAVIDMPQATVTSRPVAKQHFAELR